MFSLPNFGLRFLEALNHFEKAKTLVYRLPGVLTWPTSNVIIEESKPEKIKVNLFVLLQEPIVIEDVVTVLCPQL